MNAEAELAGQDGTDDPEPPIDPRAFVERSHRSIRAAMDEGASPDLVDRAVDSFLDIAALARSTLGKPCPRRLPSCTNHWDGLLSEQQIQIEALLRRLAIKQLGKTSADEVTYGPTAVLGGDLTRVRTDVKTAFWGKDVRLRVDYVVRSSHGRSRVVDVIIAGSSVTADYYNSFHRLLTTPDEGWAGLIRKLVKIAGPGRGRERRGSIVRASL